MADGVPSGQQYFIVNKVRGPDGSQLVVTYKGEGTPLVVEKREGTTSQMWYVSGDAGEPQNISSGSNIHIQAVPGGGGNFIVPEKEKYGWWIDGNSKEAVIYNTDRTQVWGLPVIQEAVEGPPVILGSLRTEDETQKWAFVQLVI
ncbi:hypothetical protein HD554DRAFT_2174104 [Boletus coccyginus]|nr:hypothetical protein HD554DRAFT_2174104 [Boletus coccyginus]